MYFAFLSQWNWFFSLTVFKDILIHLFHQGCWLKMISHSSNWKNKNLGLLLFYFHILDTAVLFILLFDQWNIFQPRYLQTHFYFFIIIDFLHFLFLYWSYLFMYVHFLCSLVFFNSFPFYLNCTSKSVFYSVWWINERQLV